MTCSLRYLAGPKSQFKNRTNSESDAPCKGLVCHLRHPCQGWSDNSRVEISSDTRLQGTGGLAAVIESKGGSKPGSLSSETNLVIDDLFKRTTLVEQSVELDDVCVLSGSV